MLEAAVKRRWRKPGRPEPPFPRTAPAPEARPTTPTRAQIRKPHTRYPNMGKVKLYTLLRPWCEEKRIPFPSITTTGRIIAKAHDKMRQVPTRMDARGRPKPVCRERKQCPPKRISHPPLTVISTDTVIRMQGGLRHYLFTFICPKSRFATALIPHQQPRFVPKVVDLYNRVDNPLKYLIMPHPVAAETGDGSV